MVHFDRSGQFGRSDRNVRSIGQVEFFDKRKGPGVSLKLIELETRLSRNLVKLGGGKLIKYQGWEGGSKIE